MSKKKKKELPSEDLVQEICDIIKNAYEEFGSRPELYRAVTIRVVNILIKNRSDNFPPEWK